MIHFGDITKLHGDTLPVVDVITGGSPCQDLSVAGKRAGLAGERSGLFMEQIRVVKEMRERDRANGRTGWLIRPRYMVWENVPGAFSSGKPKGADFAAVLEEIIKVAEPGADVCVCVPEGGWTKSGCYYADDGSWSIAWRLHDAQFWGVPQRRKRISLVADFGGLTAPEILFERKGLSGDFEPGGAPGEEAAGAAGGGAAGTSCYGLDHVMLSGGTTYQGRGYYDNVSACLKTQAHGVCETISFQERGGKPGGGKGILIQQEHVVALSKLNNQSVLAYGISSYDSNAMKSINPYSGIYEADTARTLDLNGGSPACNQGGMVILQNQKPIVAGFKAGQSAGGIGWEVEQTATLSANCSGTEPTVYDARGNAESVIAFTQNQRNEVRNLHDLAGALAAEPGVHQQTYVYENHSQDSRYKELGDVSETVSAKYGTGGNNQPFVVSIGNGQTNNISMAEQANTLDTMHDPQAVLQYVPEVAHALHGKANCQFREDGETYIAAVDCRNGVENENINGTLQAKSTGGIGVNFQNVCRVGAVVRRLTPLECERLQGYPDGWTNIGEWVDSKGKKHKDADSPRYKALGNSIALPFWQWMARRICAQYERTVTMGSLFDGIGGFPLAFQRCGAIPVWASEIEEFPIAVTKYHFPEVTV